MKQLLKLVFAFFAAAMIAGFAHAELGPVTRLHKLSMHLRGVPPSLDEVTEARALTDVTVTANFFNRKSAEYLKSPQHVARMRFRLSELFQVRTPSLPDLDIVDPPDYRQRDGQSFIGRDAMGKLFATMAEQNLPWDTLLTGKTYWLYQYPGFFTIPDGLMPIGDYLFMSGILRELPQPPNPGPFQFGQFTKPDQVNFASSDTRIAGAVTTMRFFDRYSTTNVNKNRRRAAAIFNMFLCDPMVAEVGGTSGESKHEVIDDLFKENYRVTAEDIDTIVKKGAIDPHGSDARCMACHYKLDPMGWGFQNIGIALNPMASPGELVFERKGSGIVREKFRGLGQMGEVLVKQPEFLACQTKWFWKEFIGKDVELTPARNAELGLEFDRRGRRVNDFIAYLVNQPEFYNKPVKTTFPSFDKMKTIFQRCDTCHAGEGIIPDFAVDGFIGGNLNSHQEWLGKIRTALFKPDGDPDQMPRGLRKWTADDRQTLEGIKAWLKHGAPGADGQKQIAEAP